MSKILAIRFSALGDVAMTIPVLTSAARLSPDDELVVLTRRQMAPLFDGLAPNLRCIGIDLSDKRYKGIAGMVHLYRDLRAEGFDRVADLHDVIRSKQLRTLFAVGGAKVTHIDKERHKRRALTRQRHKRMAQLKTSFTRYAEALDRAGLPTDDSFTTIYEAGRPDTAQLQPLIEGLRGKHWIGVAPFTTHRGKELPIDTTRRVVAALAAGDSNHVFLFGAGRRETDILKEWEQAYDNVTMAAGRLTMGGELLLMSKLDCMVSMDSANMHLASLVGIPVVSVWGATHPYCGFMGWKQSADNAVQLDLPCRPCSMFGQRPCRTGGYECMAGITPDMLLDKIRKVIKV